MPGRGSGRTNWSRSIGTGSALLAFTFALSAAAAELTATVDRRVVNLGEEITLTISISGASRLRGNLSLPPIDGFSVRRAGISTTIIQGRVSYGYNFILTPMREGSFEIPSFSLEIGGRTLESQPIRIKVAKGEEEAKGLLVRVRPEKTAVYVGEAFCVSLVVGIGRKDVRSFAAGCPWLKGLEGFRVFDPLDLMEKWNEAASTGRRLSGHEVLGIDGENHIARVGREIVEGAAYTTYTVRRMFVAREPGRYALSPAMARARVATGRRRERGRFFGDPFFDDPFFGPSIFGGRRAVTKTVADASEEVTITVKPLPEEGKPERFGGVGSFTMEVEASPTELKLGEAVTLKITISGRGDLDTVAEPRLSDESGFIIGEPEIRKEYQLSGARFRGEVEFVRPLRPRSDGVEEIPELVLSYFDVEKEEYVSLREPPIPISISKSETQPLVLSAATPARGLKVIVRAEGLSDIARVDELEDHGRRLHATTSGWMVVFLPPVCFAGVALYTRRATRLREDVAYRRRTRALGRALQLLGRAEGAGELSGVLTSYVADKVNRGEGEMPSSEARRILTERGLAELAGEAEAVLGELEAGRFAGRETSVSREKIGGLLRRLEESWRS